MHFWIDKRSQACGFGRARVAASLSGGGGMCLGFGHPPRRLYGKPLVAPVHRQPQPENSRGNHQNVVANHSTTNSSTHPYAAGRGRGTIPQRSVLQQYHHNQYDVNHIHSNIGMDGSVIGGNQICSSVTHNQSIRGHSLPTVNNQECSTISPLPNIYGSAHAHEIDQAPLNVGGLPANQMVPNTLGNNPSLGLMDPTESQLLPSHLKCGMWASLVLASVFVAGAKFYFDHQGTGLEVLIFCAFSATFFLAACTVSLCRLPRELATSPSASLDGNSRVVDDQLNVSRLNSGQHQAIAQNTNHNNDTTISLHSSTISAPPPPYHIAILLPEIKKKLKADETPPPSYDKVLI